MTFDIRRAGEVGSLDAAEETQDRGLEAAATHAREGVRPEARHGLASSSSSTSIRPLIAPSVDDPDAATPAIEDDGHGLDPDAVVSSPANGRTGVTGMPERLHLVGGSLTIESSPDQGTTVLARVSLSTNAVGP